MHIKKQCIALFISMLALPVLAQVAPATPSIDQRLANQEKRVEQGVKSGALTAKEVERLERREDKIRAEAAAAKADGKVTKQERKHLQQELNQQSRAIQHEKHDHRHDKHDQHAHGKHKH